MMSGMMTAAAAPVGIPEIRAWRLARNRGESAQGWRMEDPGTAPLTISLFGLRGDRFVILVLPSDAFPEWSVDGEVEWSLVRSTPAGQERILFALQWTMEMRGSGCLALCGREMPVFPVRPA